MDKEDRRDRFVVTGCGILLATGLTIAAAVAQPNIGYWLHPLFSTLLLPILAIAALVSIALRKVLIGPADKQTLPPQVWMAAWVNVGLILAVAFICLMAVVVAALVITPTKVSAFAEALIALVAAYVSLRLLVATVANTVLLMRHR